MWSLRNQFFTLCIAVSCVSSAAGVIHVYGYEGGEVQIPCPYQPGYESYEKYLCKEPCGWDEILITTTQSNKNKYSKHDDRRNQVFTATIYNLSSADAGKYWCAVTVYGKDFYTEFKLEVARDWCCVTPINETGIVGNQVTMQCLYPPKHKDNRKFLCKGDQRKKCRDMTNKSRFTLREDISSSSFSVIITKLKAEDAGTYWCVSDPQWSADQYTKIHLSAVSKEQTTTLISTVTMLEPTSSQATVIPGKPFEASSLSVVSITLPVLVTLAVAIIGVVVCKYKCCKVQGAGVDMNTNKTKADETEEAIEVANVYGNEDSAFSMQPPRRQLYDDAGETEQESVYQNYASTEDIYCNQNYMRALQDGQQ
ncbi:pigr [Pungitius sinensis]